MLSVFGKDHGRRRLQVRERVEHQIADEEKGAEENRKSQGVCIRQRVRDPVADAMLDLPRPEHDIPTVEAQKAAQIDAETAQGGDRHNEQPTGRAPQHSLHD